MLERGRFKGLLTLFSLSDAFNRGVLATVRKVSITQTKSDRRENMGALRKAAVISIVLLSFTVMPAMRGVSFAGEPVVRYVIVSAERDGVTVKGTIRVEVYNLGSDDMKNVDLRVAHPVSYSIEKGLFQFGSIHAGDANIVTGSYLFDEAAIAAGTSLLWRVDYDTQEGLHKQVMVPGIQVGE